MVKNLPADAGDGGSIPGWGRSPGEGNGYPLQYSCLENPIDRGTWQATVRGVTESQTRLSTHTHTHTHTHNKHLKTSVALSIRHLYFSFTGLGSSSALLQHLRFPGTSCRQWLHLLPVAGAAAERRKQRKLATFNV